MGAYKKLMWCNSCNGLRAITYEPDYMSIDGRIYETGQGDIKCDYCGSEEVVDYNECPICGRVKSIEDDYCEQCYKVAREHLGFLKRRLGASDGDLEEIICNTLGV